MDSVCFLFLLAGLRDSLKFSFLSRRTFPNNLNDFIEVARSRIQIETSGFMTSQLVWKPIIIQCAALMCVTGNVEASKAQTETFSVK